jgi:predicted RNA methylase
MEMSGDRNYYNRMFLESRKTYGLAGLTRFTFRRKHDLALDLGLNVGTFSIVFSKFFKRIIAVEASSRCISKSSINFLEAGVSNIQVIHAALADKSDESIELRSVYVGGIRIQRLHNSQLGSR